MCATHHLCICATCLLCVSCVVQILWLRYDQAKQKYMEAREKLKEADEKLAQRKAQLQEDTGPLRCVGGLGRSSIRRAMWLLFNCA